MDNKIIFVDFKGKHKIPNGTAFTHCKEYTFYNEIKNKVLTLFTSKKSYFKIVDVPNKCKRIL